MIVVTSKVVSVFFVCFIGCLSFLSLYLPDASETWTFQKAQGHGLILRWLRLTHRSLTLLKCEYCLSPPWHAKGNVVRMRERMLLALLSGFGNQDQEGGGVNMQTHFVCISGHFAFFAVVALLFLHVFLKGLYVAFFGSFLAEILAFSALKTKALTGAGETNLNHFERLFCRVPPFFPYKLHFCIFSPSDLRFSPPVHGLKRHTWPKVLRPVADFLERAQADNATQGLKLSSFLSPLLLYGASVLCKCPFVLFRTLSAGHMYQQYCQLYGERGGADAIFP